MFSDTETSSEKRIHQKKIVIWPGFLFGRIELVLGVSDLTQPALVQ